MKKTISLVLVLELGPTTESANADFTFGTPTNLGPNVNSSAFEGGQAFRPTAIHSTSAVGSRTTALLGTYGRFQFCQS